MPNAEWLAPYPRHLTLGGSRYRQQKFWKKLQQILNPVALAVDHDDCDRKLGKVLLKSEVLINRYEHVELALRERQQLAV